MENDKLTALGTRSLFEVSLAELFQIRHPTAGISLLCVNIDNTKSFNAHNGHEKGDELIRQIAKLIEELVGNGNTAFRTGGDEFMVIMATCNHTEAVAASKTILRSVGNDLIVHQLEDCGDKHCMGPANISVSIGIATTNAASKNANELVGQAKDKMLEAKRSGRNCVKD